MSFSFFIIFIWLDINDMNISKRTNFDGILIEALKAPHLDLTLSLPTSLVAMERYIGNMFISYISYHVNTRKKKKDILWMKL